mmetsp:Transcript_9632/g.28675  ORF Transcript_9632/g.28675 Transcript_9632/m.28675 type:complete len:279 (-) Transcript_9632:2667-3503(-)
MPGRSTSRSMIGSCDCGASERAWRVRPIRPAWLETPVPLERAARAPAETIHIGGVERVIVCVRATSNAAASPASESEALAPAPRPTAYTTAPIDADGAAAAAPEPDATASGGEAHITSAALASSAAGTVAACHDVTYRCVDLRAGAAAGAALSTRVSKLVRRAPGESLAALASLAPIHTPVRLAPCRSATGQGEPLTSVSAASPTEKGSRISPAAVASARRAVRCSEPSRSAGCTLVPSLRWRRRSWPTATPASRDTRAEVSVRYSGPYSRPTERKPA